MLSKDYKLTNSNHIIDIIKTGRNSTGAYFLKKEKNTSLPISKFACIISKKVSNSAVVRNKVRRRCYAIIKSHVQQNQIPSSNIVLIAKKNAQYATFAELYSDITRLLKCAKPNNKFS